MQAAPLVPLRVPTGWAVKFNAFRDIEPLVRDGLFVNADEFSEDLLFIERIRWEGAAWPPYVLDLGWYPEATLEGQYRLNLSRTDTSELLKEFTSKDRSAVRDVVDRWLDVLSRLDVAGGGVENL